MKTLEKIIQVYFARLSDSYNQLSDSSKGGILAVLSVICYALSLTLTKKALEFLLPFTLLIIQTASSVAFLWTIVLWQGLKIPLNRNILIMGCIGLLEPGLSEIFIIQGLALTTVSNATFINATEPVVTIALAYVILAERINVAKILLTLVACIGLVLITSSDVVGISQGTLLGNFLIFLGVVFSALSVIAIYILIYPIKTLTALQVAIAQQSISLVFFIVIIICGLLIQLETINFVGITPKSLLLSIAGGVLGSGVAFWLYLCALRYQSASENSLYLTLIPVFGVISAYLFLGERLSLLQDFGGMLIFIALISFLWVSEIYVPKEK